MKRETTPSNRLFFTADLHFGHAPLMKFNARPFATSDEMNACLVRNWNEIVPSDGVVYVLGDIGSPTTTDAEIERLFGLLNGTKILVRGNHDDTFSETTLRRIFAEIHDLLYLRITNSQTGEFHYMVLCHYPMVDWQNSFRGAWQLFGHVHTRGIDAFQNFRTHLFDNQYDVGVDGNGFRPVSFSRLHQIIASQKGTDGFKQTNY